MSLPKFNNLTFSGTAVHDATRKKQRPNTSVGRLLSAIDHNNHKEVSTFASQLKSVSDRGLTQIANALVEGGFSIQIAEELYERDLLSYKRVLAAMAEQNSWSGLAWMCRDDKEIEKTIQSGKTTSTSIWQNIMGSDEDLEILTSINLEKLLAGSMSGEFHPAHPGSYVLMRVSPEQNNPKVVGRYIQAITDEKVFKSARTSEVDEDSLWWRRASVIEIALSVSLDRESPDGWAWFEEMLRATPGIHQIWNDYWKTTPGKTSNSGYHNVRQYRIKGMQGLEKIPDGPGEAPPPADMSELLIRFCPSWLPDALISGGAVADAVFQTIEKNNNLYWFLHALDSQSLTKLMPALQERLGSWRDNRGRGLGHAIAMAAPGERQSPIRALLSSEQGVRLLTDPDDDGRNALFFLSRGRQWEGQKKFIVQTTRKLLNQIGKPRPRTVKKSKPAM